MIMHPEFLRTSRILLVSLLASTMLGARVDDGFARVTAKKSCMVPRKAPETGNAPLLLADFVVTANIFQQYVVNGVVNATLTLTQGQTYEFDLTDFDDEHPFVINSNANDAYGTIYLTPSYGTTVSFTAPFSGSAIYYHCTIHSSMVGTINLVPPTPLCPGDLNGDLIVNTTDFGLFISAYGSNCTGCSADINADGTVNTTDFGLFVNAYGDPCTP